MATEAPEQLIRVWQLPPFEPDEPAFYVIHDACSTQSYVAAIFEKNDRLTYLAYGFRSVRGAQDHLWELIAKHYGHVMHAWMQRKREGLAAPGVFPVP